MTSPSPLDLPASQLLPCPFCNGVAAPIDTGFGTQVTCRDCGSEGAYSMGLKAALAAWNRRPGWMPIESAPKDGAEILAWRDDCGVMIARYTCANELATMSDKERDELDEAALFQEDWFGGDADGSGYRLEGSEVPTHWMPLPASPLDSSIAPLAPLKEEMQKSFTQEHQSVDDAERNTSASTSQTVDSSSAASTVQETPLDTSRAAFELWATGVASFNPGDPLPVDGAMWGSDWLYSDERTRAAYAMWRHLHRAYRHRTRGGSIARGDESERSRVKAGSAVPHGVQPCHLCAKGFPIEDGDHYGTQALGMIPTTRCTATDGVPHVSTAAREPVTGRPE